MTLQPRDRRALVWLGVAVVVALGYFLWPNRAASNVAAASSVPLQEQRLARLRDVAATVPAKEEILKKVSADLAVREKGMIRADSIQQAQAQLVTILRKVAANQTPPVDVRTIEFGATDLLDDSYGAVNASVTAGCSIDQALKLLGSIAAQPELIATREFHVASANSKDKTIEVRLTVTGVVPKGLVPAKKGNSR